LRTARAGASALVLLSCAHFFIDLYAAALGALQPLLVDRFRMSLAQAGLLGGALVFSSSVMQPAYGYLSDRFHTRLFSTLAPAVAAVFICAAALAPGYGWLMLMVCLGGAGVASFHPHASARATAGLSSARGGSMAIFICAGTLGMAVGPTYFSAIATRIGLDRTWWAALPGLLMSVVLIAFLPNVEPAVRSGPRFDLSPLKAVWKPLVILYFLVFIRSIIQVTFAQLLPLYLHRERAFSVTDANYALSLYLIAGALGGFAGGHLSDRFGGRLVIMLSMIGCVPFLALFFLTEGWLSLIGLALGGLALLFTMPVNVVMAQELAPSQSGTVSALMMGFSWGTAGLLFIPLTGWAADLFTMHRVLTVLLVFPILGFFLAARLPRHTSDEFIR
jgi:FSR family fosmidomycin resistance protein-like MFS transporter